MQYRLLFRSRFRALRLVLPLRRSRRGFPRPEVPPPVPGLPAAPAACLPPGIFSRCRREAVARPGGGTKKAALLLQKSRHYFFLFNFYHPCEAVRLLLFLLFLLFLRRSSPDQTKDGIFSRALSSSACSSASVFSRKNNTLFSGAISPTSGNHRNIYSSLVQFRE